MAEAKIVLSATDKTRAAFETARRGLSGVGDAATSLKAQLSTLGLGVVGAAFLGNLRATANYADEMGKLAARAGTTAEAVSALSYAAKLSDVDNQTLARGLRSLGNEAAEGGKNLKSVGVSILDSAGRAKTSEVLFSDVSDVIAGIEDPAKRAAVAAKLFGERIGPELLPLLVSGKEGIKTMTDEAIKFGRVVNDEAAAKAAEFNDNLTRLGEKAAGAAQVLAGPMIQSLANSGSYFIKVANDAGTATAALVTFGSAVARTLGVDEVGGLQSKARANQNAIALTVKQIENFQKLADRGVDGAAARVASLREQYTKLQADGQKVTESLKGVAKTIEDEFKPATPAKVDKLDVTDFLGGKPPKKSSKDSPFAGATYDEQITQRVGSLLEESEVIRAKEYADTLAKLDSLYFSGAIGTELYDSAIKGLTKSVSSGKGATSEFAEEQARLAQLMAGTASAAIDEQRKDMELLTRALEEGRISEQMYLEAVTARLGLHKGAGQEDALSKGLASSIEDGILNGFRDGKSAADIFLDELKAQFGRAVLRPVIEPLAAAGSKVIGDLFTQLLSFDGGGYTGAGSRSGGLDGKGGFMAMLHPDETVVDHTKGQGAGAAPITVVQNFTVGDVATASMVRAEVAGAEARIYGRLGRSSRYGGAVS